MEEWDEEWERQQRAAAEEEGDEEWREWEQRRKERLNGLSPAERIIAEEEEARKASWAAFTSQPGYRPTAGERGDGPPSRFKTGAERAREPLMPRASRLTCAPLRSLLSGGWPAAPARALLRTTSRS